MRKKAIKISLSILAVLVVVVLFKSQLANLAETVFYSGYELPQFSEQEKIEDFEYFYSNMVESVPYLEEVKNTYGIDFINRKDYYLEMIKNTNSNVEYYGVMEAISKDLASFHTDICFPLYSNLLGLNCYNSEKTLHKFGIKSKTEAWYNDFEQQVNKYQDVNLFSVCYVNGDYILKKGWLSEEYKDMAYYKLVSVNGIPANEYVVQNLSIYSLHYDGLLDMPYREAFLFNDTKGEKVNIKWQTQDGDIVEQTLYSDKGIETIASYGYLVNDRFEYYNSETPQDVLTTYKDDENELEYIKIDSFTNNKGRELKRYLENLTYDKVVIDLRDNYGGLRDYSIKYLFAPLYSSNAQFVLEWKTPNTQLNKLMNNLLFVKLNYYQSRDDEYQYHKEVLNFNGEVSKDRQVYYLVGNKTGSAADSFVAMIKENNLGTVVGTNTGGEGLGASYICSSLDNTGLVFIYYPSTSTKVGYDNSSSKRTEPDVYVNETREDYIAYEKYRIAGKYNEYASKLQYDTVLKWVVENNSQVH